MLRRLQVLFGFSLIACGAHAGEPAREAFAPSCLKLEQTSAGWTLAAGPNCPTVALDALEKRKAELARDYLRYQSEHPMLRETKCRLLAAITQRCGERRPYEVRDRDTADCARASNSGAGSPTFSHSLRFIPATSDETAIPGVAQRQRARYPVELAANERVCNELARLRYSIFPPEESLQPQSPEQFFANRRSCERADYRRYIESARGWDAIHGVCIDRDSIERGLLSRVPVAETASVLAHASNGPSSEFKLAELATVAVERLIDDLLPLYQAANDEARARIDEVSREIDRITPSIPSSPVRRDTDHLRAPSRGEVASSLKRSGTARFRAEIRRNDELIEAARALRKEIARPLLNSGDVSERLTFLLRNHPVLVDGIVKRLNVEAKRNPLAARELEALKKKLCHAYESVRREKKRVENYTEALHALGWVADGAGTALAFTGAEPAAAAGFALGALSRMGASFIEGTYAADLNAYRALMISVLARNDANAHDANRLIDAFLKAKRDARETMNTNLVVHGATGALGLFGATKISRGVSAARAPAAASVEKALATELAAIEETLRRQSVPHASAIKNELVETLAQSGFSTAEMQRRLKDVLSRLLRCH